MSNEECVNSLESFSIAYEVKLKEPGKGIRDVLTRNLKINRLKLGLTQDKFAEKAGISTRYFAMVELAKKFPSADMLERLAEALEVELHELFYMPPVAENALEQLQETVAANIERVVAEAVEKTLSVKCS